MSVTAKLVGDWAVVIMLSGLGLLLFVGAIVLAIGGIGAALKEWRK